jgi:hypothetical protein
MVVQVCEQLTVFAESLLEPRAIVSVEGRVPGSGPLCRVAHGSSVAALRLVHHCLFATFAVVRCRCHAPGSTVTGSFQRRYDDWKPNQIIPDLLPNGRVHDSVNHPGSPAVPIPVGVTSSVGWQDRPHTARVRASMFDW